MEKRRLGKSGMVVSVIGLGTMTFGTQADKEESFKIMDAAVDAGIDFFDTAEVYPVPPTKELAGLTEEWVGDWMKDKPRESVIIATKVAGPAHGWFNPPVRHDKAAIDGFMIRRAVEGSLRRLKTDYIDLYQVHWPDAGMRPLDAIEVLDDLVREGKIRAYGVSNETCYGMMKWLSEADAAGMRRLDTIQNNFSVNNRRFEDELGQCCLGEGVSCLPYSPLAGGVLAGKYQKGAKPAGARFSAYLDGAERQRKMAERFVNEKSLANTAAIHEIAKREGIDPVTFAIAWSKQHDFVASTLMGVSSLDQLQPHIDAAEVTIRPEVMVEIDALTSANLYPMG
ncbi:Predicted oxidoreductase [Rubritalea squalenifaciens DSM 18772]|uniref:Predicted oxidoreductase n=1 Tax=Rubritalea squalenifaciens DSM 18772 TaxID=1123071 RepID=A0A1M6P3C9_9BACT|nr:aldo/keto reductase [Rubritalea squalenifaciens]SHK02406.1 Predicted oxidoreductase [Rubritalea squalenifaciens DSM 18772]